MYIYAHMQKYIHIYNYTSTQQPIHVGIYPTRPHEQEVTQGQFFKRS